MNVKLLLSAGLEHHAAAAAATITSLALPISDHLVNLGWSVLSGIIVFFVTFLLKKYIK